MPNTVKHAGLVLRSAFWTDQQFLPARLILAGLVQPAARNQACNTDGIDSPCVWNRADIASHTVVYDDGSYCRAWR